MTENEIGSLVFVDEMIADRNSLVYSEVYGHILSAQIQSNAPNHVGHSFTI